MWLFKFIPDFLFYIWTLSGVVLLVIGKTRLIKFIPNIKYTGLLGNVLIVTGVFLLGMMTANNWWFAKSKELEEKVVQLTQESTKTNVEIKEKVVVKREYYRERGNDVIQFVDREIVKYNNDCKIPAPFIEQHNKATEK